MYKLELERYIALRRQLAAIEAEIEELKPAVAEELRRQGGSVKSEGYELLLRKYTAWDYSQTVLDLQISLNATKLQERQDGTAVVREQRDMLVLRSLGAHPPQPNAVFESSVEWIVDEE